MHSNASGRLFTFATFGESHGPAIGCVVDGCPALVPLDESDIQPLLDRRRPGGGPYVTQRNEPDHARILSGVVDGKTTGHPICIVIENTNQRSKDYSALADVYRPGHADAVYWKKYGIHDVRGGGRSSARETAARVAAGAVAEKMLSVFPGAANIRVQAGLVQLGPVKADTSKWDAAAVDENPFFCPDAAAVEPMRREIVAAMADGDSLGGIIEARVTGVPAGLGEPLYDKLDARIAHMCMGLNAVKGVEIGDGFAAASARGSANNDAMREPASGTLEDAFLTNHAGGVLGGVSTGQPIVVRVALKPTPSIGKPQRTVDRALANTEISVAGRHDPAVAIRAVPVVEAMLWLILADFHLLHRARKA